MLKTESKEIAGKSFMVTTLGTKKGLRVWTKILNVIGEPLGHAAAMGIGQEGAELRGLESLGAMFGALAAKLDNEAVHTGIIEALVNKDTTTVDKRPLNFDAEFSGEYDVLTELLWFAMELNFSSFFRGKALELQGAWQKVLATQAPRGKAPSTGESGESS